MALPSPVAAAASVASSSPRVFPDSFAALLQTQQALMKAQRESYESLVAMQPPEFVHRMVVPNDHPQIRSLMAQVSQLTEQRDAANRQLDASNRQKAQLAQQSAQLQQQNDAAAAQIVQLTLRCESAEATILARDSSIAELQRAQVAAESQISVKREIVQQARHEKLKADDEREEAEEERKEESKRRRVAEDTAAAAQQELAAAAEREKALEAEKSALEKSVECKYCFDADATVAFNCPAGHVALCAACNVKDIRAGNTTCPICRGEVTERVTVMRT